jgi:hypothetical protein
MKAIGLRRFAPGLRKGTAQDAAVLREPMPPELQTKMRAEFERARVERIEAQIPEEGARGARDPRSRANSAAFLMLDGERRALGARLCRPYWRRRDRYRDLILITRFIRLESEHLAGLIGLEDSPPSLRDAPPPRNGDTPAAWTRPWGSAPMVEMATAFSFYRDHRDRLARRLSARTRARAAGEGARQWNRVSSRFERALGEWRLQPEPVGAPQHDRQEVQRLSAELAAEENTTERARPWAGHRFTKAAAIAATAFVAAGVAATFGVTHGGGHSDSASTPSRPVASAPERPLPVLGDGLPARGRGAANRAIHRSRTDEHSDASAVRRAEGSKAGQNALSASGTAAAAPEPASPAAPAPSPAPAPTSAPAPQPAPTPNSGPGPVSSLPAPVNSLPAPGQGSGGGG